MRQGLFLFVQVFQMLWEWYLGLLTLLFWSRL